METNLQNKINDLSQRIQELTADTATARRIAIESEQKFQDIVMQAPVGITILRGRKLVAEMANETYLAIIDRKHDEFVGKPLFEALPEVENFVAPILYNILETGEPYYGYEFEVTLHRHGKKEQTFFNFAYHPLCDKHGAIDGIIVVANEVTAQVLAKKALEQREIQFRNMMMKSPIAMAIFRGRDFLIELANNAMLHIWQRPMAEVESKKLFDIFPELLEQKFPDLLNKVMDTGVAHKENEAAAIVGYPDGSNKKYYFDFEYAPLMEIDGTTSGVIATVYDVTERVEARHAIEAAQRQYGTLIELLPVGIYTIDDKGYVEICNKEAENIWGRTPEKGKDKWCGAHELFELDGTPVELKDCAMAQAFNENRPITTEVYIGRPDGTMRHIIAHPRPLHNAEGSVIGAMNVLVDITERKEAEMKLRASEEKFRTLADSMPQMIWTAEADGRLTYYSRAVFEYTGMGYEEIMTKGWQDIVHPDDRKNNVELWMQSVTTGEPFHYQHRFRRHSGEYRWQLSRAVPQRDEHGNIRMWVGTSTDIHDGKLFADALAEKVEERTRELKQSNENLLRSNNDLLQFAYVASHDLQEPLRKIQTFVSRIADIDSNRLSEKGKDYFGRIEKSSARTQQLIKDLLEYSRANRGEKHFEPADLNELLAKVKDDLHVAIKQSHANITVDKLPTLPVIQFQFVQLFTNLISNAIKFAKPDTPPQIKITADIVKGADTGHQAAVMGKNYDCICIADNGIGFEPEYTDQIFRVFQRLHTRDRYEGTGIGLAICKKIVENHHGFITAESSLGQGATFCVYIPRESL